MKTITWRKRLRLGDTVKIISGSEKGTISTITAFTKSGVIVKGCHKRYRFVRRLDPAQQAITKVRIFEETAIDPSKIMIFSRKSNNGGRIAHIIDENGNKRRKIISTGEIL